MPRFRAYLGATSAMLGARAPPLVGPADPVHPRARPWSLACGLGSRGAWAGRDPAGSDAPSRESRAERPGGRPPPWVCTSGITHTATVGTPVTQRPPCSPGRAVFPPPVPRLHSPPRRVKPWLLWPAGRLAHAAPVRPVRAACPCRAACFRRVLPQVVGFPHRRVRPSIRLPNRLGRAFPWPGLLRLPRTCGVTARRFQHGAVSGFPLLGLKSGLPYPVAAPMPELRGSPTCFDASLPACHGLRTPADLAILA